MIFTEISLNSTINVFDYGIYAYSKIELKEVVFFPQPYKL